MKRVEPNRYPHSANLFQFCKSVLEDRYQGRVKVIDQDVGAILGYDPADCSHWKKGKKNIRSLATLKTLSNQLNVDEGLLVDLTNGKLDVEEAIFEIRGYGRFGLSAEEIEEYKKEYFRSPESFQVAGQFKSFDELFQIKHTAIESLVESLLKKLQLSNPPVYITELARLFNTIELEFNETILTDMEIVGNRQIDGGRPASNLKLRFQKRDMASYTRFKAIHQIFQFLVNSGDPLFTQFATQATAVRDIHANLFAAAMLVPRSLLKNQVDDVNIGANFIEQMASSFHVSRTLLSYRLKSLPTGAR